MEDSHARSFFKTRPCHYGIFSFIGFALFSPFSVFAGTVETPGPLDNAIIVIRDDLKSSLAVTLVTIAFFVGSGMFFLGRQRGIVEKIGGVVAGGSVAIGFASIVSVVCQ